MTGSLSAPRALEVVETALLPSDVDLCELAVGYPAHWFAPREQVLRADEIEDRTIAWMAELGLLPTAEQEATVRAMHPRYYGGCPSSMLSFDSALLYTKYLTMWLLWDDEIAEQATDVASLEPVFAAMAGTAATGADEAPYLVAWRQMGAGLAELGGSAAYRERWVESMREYAVHAIDEGRIRRSSAVDARSLDEAFLMRGHTIGAKPAIIFLEACGGVELPAHLTTVSEYAELAWCSALLQAIQNDLASVAKDYRQGQLDTNVVLRYWHREGCSLRDACRAVIDIHDRAVADFDRLAAVLLERSDEDFRDRLATYLDLVRYMETGFGFYHVRAHRYVRRTVVDDGKAHRLVLVRRSQQEPAA